MRETVWHFSIILLIAGGVFFTNLGESRLWDRDEPRNAGCAAEMMASGDWVVPRFNDELRHQKPVLLYWLIMSAYSVMGVNEFAARFWSAALALGTTLATYGIARRLTTPRIGLLAAVALSTSLMFDVAARAVTPDSLLIFCSTMAILIYVLVTFSKRAENANGDSSCGTLAVLKCSETWFPRNVVFVIAFYMMLGLGVLAKGPVGFLLPMATIGLFMLISSLTKTIRVNPKSETRFSRVAVSIGAWLRPFHPAHFWRTFWSMRPLPGVAVVLLIACPWYWMVDARTDGDFTRSFFIGEHFGRATTAMENHRGGLWFYPVAILVGFFPWSVFWGPFVVGLFRRKFNPNYRAAMTLMACWIGVQVGFFSLAQTKLPSYVTPCYPALAILAAIYLSEFCQGQFVGLGSGSPNNRQPNLLSERWLLAAMVGLVVSGIAITGGIGLAAFYYLPNQVWIAGLGLIPMLGGCVLIWLLTQGQTKHVPSVFAGIAFLFCWGLFGFGTVSVDSEQQSHRLWEKTKPGVLVGSYGCLESSWVFYLGRPIHELSQSTQSDVISAVSSRERIANWKPKAHVSVESLLWTDPNAMLITSGEHLDTLQKRLPEDYKIIQTADYFLKNKQIYLLGRESSPIAQRKSRAFIHR